MPVINDYRFGHVVIDDREHSRDVIVLPNRVVPNWWRKDGHSLVVEDLAEGDGVGSGALRAAADRIAGILDA